MSATTAVGAFITGAGPHLHMSTRSLSGVRGWSEAETDVSSESMAQLGLELKST